MKPRQLIILSLILILLAVLVIVKQQQKPARLAFEEESSLQLRLNMADVGGVTIQKAGDQVALQKTEAGWQIPALWNAKADPDKIKRLITALTELRGELRSSDPALFPDYEIQDDEGIMLSFSSIQGAPLLEVILGSKLPSDDGGAFIRQKGSPAVYFTSADLLTPSGLFGDIKKQKLEPKFWVDLRFLDISMDMLESMTIQDVDGDKKNVLAQLIKIPGHDGGESRWKLDNVTTAFPIDELRIRDRIEMFRLQRGKEIVDPSGDYGLDKPERQVILRYAGDRETVLDFKKVKDEKSDDRYVRISGRPEVFLIPGYVFQSIELDPFMLLTQKPFLDSAAEWTSVEVQAPDKHFKMERAIAEGAPSEWSAGADGAKVAQEKLAAFAEVIREFTIMRFLNPKTEAALTQGVGDVILDIGLKSGEHIRLQLSSQPNTEGTYSGNREGFSPSFVITEATYDQLLQFPFA